MKFKVRLVRTVEQETYVFVEAPSLAAIDTVTMNDLARNAVGAWEDSDQFGIGVDVDTIEECEDAEPASIEVTANGTIKEL
jgi:hypothetical protein